MSEEEKPEWQMSSNGFLHWGSDDGEGKEFMVGLVCGRLQERFFRYGTDDDYLKDLSGPFEVAAKEKIRKIATFHFVNVTFVDKNEYYCTATFTRMNAEERAASAAQVAIDEAKRKKPWE